MTEQARAAWTAYWREATGGCLPGRGAALEGLQQRLWTHVARQLGAGAAVLDLATGGGAVLRRLARVRSDLHLTGVDNAERLPEAPGGTTLLANVANERLPFGAGSIDCVTSQFGIEYGDLPASAAEFVRVLVPGGGFAFLIHHADSPILAAGRARSEALAWLLGTSDWFAGGADASSSLHGCHPVAVEIAEAIRQAGDDKASIRAIEKLAKQELVRLHALLAAGRSESGIIEMAATLTGAGLIVDPPALVREMAGRPPLGWWLSGEKPA